ncbi:MAG: bifunctional pyr operon transcriptional regulator/uracil phosphoribosyltransferase PyrR [Verrucomicrobia bacterium]|nr:bifunctional pyr operon transcriptional regulator/uracil phosphoribosyltransferase PyrR [Verrucomicrobiota bacterium]
MTTPLLDAPALRRTLGRMAREIAAANPGTGTPVLVGIQRGGVPVARRLAADLAGILGRPVACGSLDVTFYRDDLDQRAAPTVHPTEIPGDIQGRTVVLVDDVFFTGRTIRAAMDALHEFGRPSRVQLAVVIDRGHRQLPIRPDVVGQELFTTLCQSVLVRCAAGGEGTDDGVFLRESPPAASSKTPATAVSLSHAS